MNNIFKQGGYLLVSVFVLGLSLHAAAAVFTCTENGTKTYTSEPTTSCHADELGKVGSYQGGEYKLRVEKLSQDGHEKSGKKAEKRAKKTQAKKKTKSKQNIDDAQAVQKQ